MKVLSTRHIKVMRETERYLRVFSTMTKMGWLPGINEFLIASCTNFFLIMWHSQCPIRSTSSTGFSLIFIIIIIMALLLYFFLKPSQCPTRSTSSTGFALNIIIIMALLLCSRLMSSKLMDEIGIIRKHG